jgi:hypothetical protein
MNITRDIIQTGNLYSVDNQITLAKDAIKAHARISNAKLFT